MDPSAHLSVCPPGLLWPTCTPTLNLDVTPLPPHTCHFKSLGAWWACPQGLAVGSWTAAVLGEALLAPRGLLDLAMLGKLKQRLTMASLPPWAALEQDLHGWPLGAPVISCAGYGAPGQHTWAGSRQGITSPPAGLAFTGQSSCSLERGSSTLCLLRRLLLQACVA